MGVTAAGSGAGLLDSVLGRGVRRRAMIGRDRDEEHRASTPLELLFDLCFVVAVSQAAASLHEALAEGHVRHAIAGYLSVFFAIWWAWLNFTWFASAYDTDDVPYRLLTLAQMAGVLVLASGVGAAFDGDFQVVTVGYVIMRLALMTQWLRAAASDAERRRTALRYASMLLVVQTGWVVRLALPDRWGWTTFVILVALDIAGPFWAEHSAPSTPWHPEHIAERYGLFTIIVLGECILSAFVAVQSSITSDGISAEPLVIAAAGLTAMFGLWWSYFRIDAERMLRERPYLSFTWGYAHYALFAAIAALGAGIALAAQSQGHGGTSASGAESDAVAAEAAHEVVERAVQLSQRGVALAVGVPVGVALLMMSGLRALTRDGNRVADGVGYGATIAVLLAAVLAPSLGLGTSLAMIALVVVAKVTVGIVTTARQAPSSDDAWSD